MFPWKESPFVRLLPPLTTGIILQYLFPLAITILWSAVAVATLAATAFHLAPTLLRYRFRILTGLLINTLIISCGAIIVHYNQPFNKSGWIASNYTGNGSIKAVLQEPL